MKTITKDPIAELDYTWDWSLWLLEGDPIEEFTFSVPDDLELVTSMEDAGRVTIWLNSGTSKKSHTVSCRIITEEGRSDKRSMIFNINDR